MARRPTGAGAVKTSANGTEQDRYVKEQDVCDDAGAHVSEKEAAEIRSAAVVHGPGKTDETDRTAKERECVSEELDREIQDASQPEEWHLKAAEMLKREKVGRKDEG